MKILVFSDSHGCASPIRAALAAHRTADAAVFLGDGLRDFSDAVSDFPLLPQIAVPGNCDPAGLLSVLGLTNQPEALVDFGGKKCLILHGHTVRVKMGYDLLLAHAAARGADVVLFGHTHIPENTLAADPDHPTKQILLFNPGSIGQSSAHPYGILTIEGDTVAAEHRSAGV